MHCFSGTQAQAARALAMGFYLSFAGNLTYPKSNVIQQVAASAPADRILVETDAPFLAPIPLRGQQNRARLYDPHRGVSGAASRNHRGDNRGTDDRKLPPPLPVDRSLTPCCLIPALYCLSMAADNSFDVVSKVEIQEVKNAIDQATKEVNARFDLKNSKSKIELEGKRRSSSRRRTSTR